MNEINQNLDLIKICKIQADPNRLNQVLDQRNKLIMYSNRDGNPCAYLNMTYKLNLESKIESFSGFWYEFCCLDSLYEEQKIHFSKFIKNFENLKDFYDERKNTIDNDIEFYTHLYQKSNVEMEEYRKLEETEVGRRDVEKKMTERLMNLKNKTGYLEELQRTKLKIKEFAEKKAHIEKDWNSSQRILECLYYMKNMLINDEIARIDERVIHYLNEIDEVNRFITNIKEEEYEVLTNANQYNINDVMRLNELMQMKINEFKEINLDFMFIFFSTYVNHECIQFIHEQWNMYVQVAGFITAFPYFKAEMDFFLGKKNKAEFKFDSTFSRDHLKRVKECMENLQDTTQILGREIENVQLIGGIEWDSSEIIGYNHRTDSNGRFTSETIKKPYISSFYSNIYLENQVQYKREEIPEYVNESEKTLYARNFRDKCSYEYAQVYYNFTYYQNINEEYEKLKKRIIDHKNTILPNHNALNEDLENLCLRFRLFRESFSRKNLCIDESFKCSVFSLFLINCNIHTRPGCCSSGILHPLITNHTSPDYLFSCFIKAFKTNKKQFKAPACQDDNLTYFNYKGIELDDIRLVLYDLRVLGSLKSNDGKIQEVHGRIREEEFDRAMFNIISQSIKCVAILSQMRFKIDSEKGIKQIESWQEAGEKIILDNRYKKLITLYQKAKFTTDTRIK